MHLEVVHVIAVADDVHVVHPLLDTPREARPLVSGEIEAAVALQMVEKDFEILLALWCRLLWCSRGGHSGSACDEPAAADATPGLCNIARGCAAARGRCVLQHARTSAAVMEFWTRLSEARQRGRPPSRSNAPRHLGPRPARP